MKAEPKPGARLRAELEELTGEVFGAHQKLGAKRYAWGRPDQAKEYLPLTL
jgi:hypothetical protein